MMTNVVRRATATFLCALSLVWSPPASQADDWPQWLGPQRDAVWRETGILDKFPTGGPPVRWRVPIGGGFTGPAVAKGRVYVMDRRPPTHVAPPTAGGAIPGGERVLCLNEADGKVLWQHEYDCPYTMSYAAGPRATPLVADGQVYTLGAEGNLCCLDAATGRVVWARDFKKELGAKTPIWGFAAHPLLDGNRLITLVGGAGAVAVAFDKTNGKELWRSLSAKEIGYAPPMIINYGGHRRLIIWHPEAVNALDLETGKVLWTVPFESRTGLSVATPRQAGDALFITTFYNGAILLRLAADAAPTTVWRSQKASERDTTELHSIIPTPFLEDGYVYGVCSYGQLRCLELATGRRVWETLAATTPERETRWANVFLVKQADRFFLFNERGDLIIARLTPKGYEEISRAHLLDPTNPEPGRPVVWSHPAFANRSVYARNDRELIAVSLAAKP